MPYLSPREAYDRVADRYDAEYRSESDLFENQRISDFLHGMGAHNGSVLDVGCGTGLVADLLPELQDGAYVGVDPSHGMIQRARAKHPGQVFVHGSANAIPLYAEKFDAVVSLWALGYVKNLLTAAHELERRIGRHGRVLVITYAESERVNGFCRSPSRVLEHADIATPVTLISDLTLKLMFPYLKWSHAERFGVDGIHAILFGEAR